jgi:hypothetical protein
MDYSYLLRRAWEITWRYKFLWIFGFIMALCGQGSGGRANFQMQYRMPAEPGAALPEFPSYFPEPLGETPIVVYVIAGLLLIIVFGAVGIIASAICRSALIRAADRVETGESISLGQSWRDGLAKATPVGLLQLLLYSPLLLLFIIGAIIFLAVFWPFFSQLITMTPSSDSPPADFLTFLPLFFGTICTFICLVFILQLIIALFLTFGSRAIILENQGVLGSFSRSWLLFRQNLGPSILLALIVIVITFVIGLILAIPAAIIMFPLMFAAMPELLSETGPSMESLFLLGCVGLLIALVFSLVNGIFQVFSESLWTLAYREFMKKEALGH